jgi:aspartate racemase
MRTLGLIGGTSWHSTQLYYREINEKFARLMGDDQNPELILHSIDIRIMRRQNREEIQDKYLEVAEKLEAAGAQAVLICANTPHLVFGYVQPKIGIPILHIGDAIGRKARHFGIQTVALLGTLPTMTLPFIKDYLKQHYDIHCVLPEEEDLQEVHRYIADELTQGKFSKEAKSFFIDQCQKLSDKGAEGVILGCTELPILLESIELGLPAIDTTREHIDMALDFILEKS